MTATATVKELRELLINLEMAGHGNHLVFLSSDPEGNGFNAFCHGDSPEDSGISFEGVTYEGSPVLVLWAGAPERVDLEFTDGEQ